MNTKTNSFYFFISIFCILLITLFLFTACEKDITVDIPTNETKVVIEGQIEAGKNPYVILSRTSGYFSAVDSVAIANTMILNGVVLVKNNAQIDTLKPTLDFNFFPPIIYTTNSLVGQIGQTYTLTVIADGKTFNASTIIPQPVELDSLWFELDPPNDDLGFIYAYLSDPPGKGNTYRWFAKRLGKDRKFIAPYGSVFNDDFFDGKTFKFGYNRGSEFNSQAEDDKNDERGYFKVGDSVVVKYCSIDKDTYQFYRTFETDVANNGNPFAQPMPVKTNIDNNGLGVWGGLSATYDTLVAQ
ncbi:MAG: DUF4249 domain-containing protein [Bacteroidetes bacterium]|nr:DUF4249 domain-containing protein [Bacteroidota bacterium]